MSFFIKKGSKRKKNSESLFSNSSKSLKKRKIEEEDEIISSDSEVEGVSGGKGGDVGYESEEEEEEESDSFGGAETAEEKRVRLAELYIQEIIKEEKCRVGDDSLNQELINQRLKRDDDLEKGKLRLKVADSILAIYPESNIVTYADSKAHAHQKSLTVVLCHDNFLFSASKNGGLIKWDLKEKKKLIRIKSGTKSDLKNGQFKGHCSPVNALAISSDGKFLASGDDDNLIHIWNPTTMELLKTFKGHRDSITGLAFRINTHTLYSCSGDRSVKIWSCDEMAYSETLFGHQDKITGIDAGRRERCVTSGGRDGSVRIWKIVEESQLVFNGPATSTDAVKLINDEHFVTAGEDGHISLWGNMKKKPLCTIKSAHGKDPVNDDPNWISAITAFPSSDLIASGSRDGFIRLWKCSDDFRNLEEIQKIPMTGFVNSLSFNKEGTILVAGIGQEHRLGRWFKIPEAKNCIKVISIDRKTDDESMEQ